MSSSDLLAATRGIVEKERGSEADLLVLLGEIDERKLYLEQACPSMFAFCKREYRFSEDMAWNRIAVARMARRVPQVLDAIRTGQVHLAGLRVLGHHLTADNHRELLNEAAGKSRREIEEIVARIAPQPGIPTIIRRDLSEPGGSAAVLAAGKLGAAYVFPLAADLFKFQFSGSRACRDKLREAQDLLRHRVPSGDVGTIFELALDTLIAQVKQERFAATQNAKDGPNEKGAAMSPRPKGADVSARPAAARNVSPPPKKPEAPKKSRHIPNKVKRIVYARDGGRCAFIDERGRRCSATNALEFDHIDGFARTGCHDPNRIRLLCRAHNQHAAEKLYGRTLMEQFKASRRVSSKIARGPPS